MDHLTMDGMGVVEEGVGQQPEHRPHGLEEVGAVGCCWKMEVHTKDAGVVVGRPALGEQGLVVALVARAKEEQPQPRAHCGAHGLATQVALGMEALGPYVTCVMQEGEEEHDARLEVVEVEAWSSASSPASLMGVALLLQMASAGVLVPWTGLGSDVLDLLVQ